jgi:hypothetical protein
MWLKIGGLVLTATVAQMPLPVAGVSPDVHGVLTTDLKFTPSEMSDLAAGKVVRHSIESSTPGEIAAVGGTWVGVPVDSFLKAFRDIVTFKKGEGVLQIGRFSDPPQVDDLAALTLDDEDFDARRCRVGDCSIRLSAADIGRFQQIDWNAPDARLRVSALFKQVLTGHLRAYWAGESGVVRQYDNGKRSIRPAVEFAGILANSPEVGRLAPGLPEHLRDFRAAPLEGAEDFLYWSKERFGIAPFISVTHVTIARTSPGTVVITSKDVYSSRYLDSSLGLTLVTEAPGGCYLVYANRSRADALKGGFTALRRAFVERRARSSLDQNLKAVKGRLEQRR